MFSEWWPYVVFGDGDNQRDTREQMILNTVSIGEDILNVVLA